MGPGFQGFSCRGPARKRVVAGFSRTDKGFGPNLPLGEGRQSCPRRGQSRASNNMLLAIWTPGERE